jgi:hypothetical protein
MSNAAKPQEVIDSFELGNSSVVLDASLAGGDACGLHWRHLSDLVGSVISKRRLCFCTVNEGWWLDHSKTYCVRDC